MPVTMPSDVRQRPKTPLGGKLSRTIDLLEACIQEKSPLQPLLERLKGQRLAEGDIFACWI
jgi:hypothetical protein